MKNFASLLKFMAILALPLIIISCSKSKSSGEVEEVETFKTINARMFFENGSTVNMNGFTMGVGNTIRLYVGNSSSKAVFNGNVSWTATGSGEVTLTAVSKSASGVVPPTKAGYNYGTVSASTGATQVLQLVAKSDGMVTLRASDPIGNAMNVVITIIGSEAQ
ncbi:MAG: hypothetical protein J5604_02600 [Bacteroidales bacterium]|nr:hypothetical protein [Bacteroidales bacterium]